MKLRVVRGTIVGVVADVVVTAGNSRLIGALASAAISNEAAGPEVLQALRPLAPCPPGSAVVTPAFRMTNARWVIHAVGPRYAGPQDARVLASAYTAALARADEVGARTGAFPSISTCKYRFPEEEAHGSPSRHCAERRPQWKLCCAWRVASGRRPCGSASWRRQELGARARTTGRTLRNRLATRRRCALRVRGGSPT